MSRPTPEEVLSELRRNFLHANPRVRRRFLPGLLVSFIGLVRAVRSRNVTYASLEEFYQEFPRQTQTGDGGRANTLIVRTRKGTTQSIRPFYEAFQKWVRADQKRLDYPKSPAHATQAWQDYQHWLACVVGLDDAALHDLEKRVSRFVLDELPAHQRDLTTIRREPPRFHMFLEQYDFKKRAGPSGAAFQGTVFAYLRADAPHLQVQVAKVRVGGKREGKVGDVDARDGEALVLAAEVKQFVVDEGDLGEFVEFAEDVAKERALGLVVALDFTEDAKRNILDLGLHPVTKQDLIDRVRLWDALKQRIAVQALLFYVSQVEQNTELIKRVGSFFSHIEEQLQSSSDADESFVVEEPAPSANIVDSKTFEDGRSH